MPGESQPPSKRSPYYHCITRRVRRTFLWGEDSLTGKSYEHRKAWVVERLGEFADIFAIDVCAYAVMSNHYHQVLRIDKDKAISWQHTEVIECWERLFSLLLLVSRYQLGITQKEAEIQGRESLSSTMVGSLAEHLLFHACAQ